GQRAIQIGLADGRLRLHTMRLGAEGGRWKGPALAHARYPAVDDPPTRRLPGTLWNLGFAGEHRVVAGNYESSLVLLPMWLPLALAIAAAEWLRRLARRALRAERRRSGLCPRCGYDRRAAGARCPECGAMVERANAISLEPSAPPRGGEEGS